MTKLTLFLMAFCRVVDQNVEKPHKLYQQGLTNHDAQIIISSEAKGTECAKRSDKFPVQLSKHYLHTYIPS